MKIAEKMKMKKVLMTLVLLPLMALADTETVDGIAWTYTVSAGEASVGNGWDSAIPSDTSGAITIPSNLGGCPVTDIGSFAFAELYDLESVKIPNTVKSIGEGSFFACSFLDGVEIPDSVEIIGAGAFKDCSWMQTIYIGNGLKWIETDAFKGCSNLQKIMLPEGLESIGNEAFAGCWRMQSVSLPMSVQEVDSSAFSGCSSLTGVTTPTHRGTMSDWFTPVCGQIREVTIPYSESMIAVNMFSNCISLVKVSFDKTPTSGAWQGVSEIGDGAFYNCRSLVDIELPHSLLKIGREAFRNCIALQAISLPDGVQQIGDYAFCSCGSLKDLTLSESLTEIPDYAFYGCDILDSFTVPESVSYLGSRFVGCGNPWQGTSVVYFLGNAPSYAVDAYAASRSDLKSYVIPGTLGWDGRVYSRDIPQSWPVANSYARGISEWSQNPFDVTFDACGGIFENDGSSAYACQQITYTYYALPPYYPKREGCVFDGWWTERTGGTRVTASTRVLLAKAHTLYAHWIAGGDVFVRFNATGGTVSPESGIYQTGKPYGGLPVPTREYWDFAGWWTEVSGGTQILPGSEVPAADVELFARWNPARYKIVFHSAVSRYSWEDEETYTQEFTYGETVTLRENPFTSYGLTFAGWATERDGLPVYADRKTLTEITSIHDGVIDLYAVWVGDQYAIRFDSNGGYGVMPNQACFIGVYQQLSSNLFTRAGYVFDGWSRTKTGRREYTDMKSVINLSTIKNDTVVLYAVWKEIKYYTITFDARGGECDEDSRKVREGEVIGELPVPTRVGYVFRCWTTGSSGGMVLDPDSVISYSRTYYAQWERAERIRISFDANGGRIGDHVKETHVGNFTVLGKLIPTATWTGYVFLGWFTEQEGGVQVSESTEVSADVTFYAHWRLLNQPVSVVFDPQGGQCSKTNVTGISGKAIGTLPTYSRVGYTFDGWYTAPEGGTMITTQKKVTDDVTYYAHATPITYRVRFNPNCGTGKMEDQSFVYDQEQSLTTNSFELSSHTFVGWSMAASGKMSIKDLIWDEQSVSNLCARQGATIDLYAVWMRTSSIRESTYNTVKKYDPEDPEDYWFEWSSEMTLKRGTSHLFWMTPEDPESVLWMDVWYEDDECWLGPSEWFDKENEDGTVTSYLLLTAEDWEWVGFDKSSACFTVRVEGWGGPESFRFCHREVDYDMSVKWDVRFDATEGECAERWREVTHNKAIGTLPIPTRSKYKFNGWYTAADGGTKVSNTTKVTADVTYYAQWSFDTKAKCHVTFVPNGGMCVEPERQIQPGEQLGALPCCARMGYEFVGWFTDSNGGNEVRGDAVLADDLVLYAHWREFKGDYELGVLYGPSSAEVEWSTVELMRDYADSVHQPMVIIAGGPACSWCRNLHDSFKRSGKWDIPCLMFYDYSDGSYWDGALPEEFGIKGIPAVCCYWNIGNGNVIRYAETLYPNQAGYVSYSPINKSTINKDLISAKIMEVFTSFFNRARVCFDGGGSDAERIVDIGTAIGTLPVLTREKYAFNGWYTKKVGGAKISSSTKVTESVVYHAHWTYTGKNLVSAKFVGGCEGMGTVSGGKSAKGGTKVTLKAVAKPGFVFVGWYRDAEGWDPVEGETDYRSPSYSYVVGEDDATFYAKFISVDEDWVSVWCQPDDEYARGVEIEPLAVEVNSASLATVKVTGLPTGLKFTAKPLTLKATNYRAAVDLPANTIYGTPTKSGIYTATITATTASKKSEAYKVDLVVRADGEYLVDVMGVDGAAYPTNGSDTQHAIQWGKMSGYGVFKPNATAILKATANNGYVFAGWFSDVACVCEGGEEDDGCVYTPAEGTVDYRSTSFPVKVGYEDVLYYARFVRSEDDDMLWANVENAYYLNGPWSLKLDIESMSLPTVTVKGLPSGLKFDAKTLTISGTPTKPGIYPITLSLKNKTITKVKTQNFTLYVANIESPYLVGVDYSSDAYPCSVGSDVRFDLGACVRGGYSISAVSGLPKGISYNKATGMIEGCPTQDGAYTVAIALKNGRLSSNATMTMNVSWIEESFSLRLYRYVAVLESLSVRQYGDGLSFEKPQGTLPSGINVSVDTQRNVMTIEGIPTSEGTFCMNYTLNVQKGGKKTPCAKIVLQMEVVDPTQVGTGKDGAALNDSCEKLRTFEDLMIFANDDELGEDNAKRLLGTLRLTLPVTGKASAKFLCESGTVSFAAKSWDKIDLEDGSLKTTLVGTTKIFKDWMLEVAADQDGGVRLWMSSPSATYNSLYFGKEAWSKTHPATDYSGYYTVTLAPATDDAGVPIVTGTGKAYAPVGSGYVTLKLEKMSSLQANSGTVIWAGKLPNGTSISGSGILAEMSEEAVWLPMVNFSTKDKFAGVVELERGAAAAEPGAACWESVSTPTWDAATVRTWWRHTEAVPKTDKNEFTVRYEPYGGIYSKYDLNCCCEMMGAGSTMSLTIDVPASFVSDYYGKFEAVDSIDVKISSQSDIRVDSMGGRNNITLSHNRSTGIVSGRFDLHYTDAKTLTNKKLMAEYAGVIQLGCGDKCGCGISLPFVKGFWCVTDRIGYQKDEVSGAFKKWLPSKRGGAFTIELEE